MDNASIFSDDVGTSPNGVVAPVAELSPEAASEVMPEGMTQPLPRVDPTRGVFITSRNEEIELSDRPVSALVVKQLTQNGKPKIPMVKVTLLGRHEQLEANPNDPGYKALLAEWETDVETRILKYLFTVGVKGSAPQPFIEEHLAFFPDATDMDLKYLWVCSLVPNDDIEAISDAIMGRMLPTAKGVAASAESFRSDG